MAIGYVMWFDSAKGYGFVQSIPKAEGNSTELFVHYKDILGEGYKVLEKGQLVGFDVEVTEEGRVAKNINRDVEESLLVQYANELARLAKKFGFKLKAQKS